MNFQPENKMPLKDPKMKKKAPDTYRKNVSQKCGPPDLHNLGNRFP